MNPNQFLKKLRSLPILAFVMLTSVQAIQAQAQLTRPPTSGEIHTATTGQDGVDFKEPKGYMRAAFATVKGILFLHPKNAEGIFVVYPTGDETIAALRQRVLANTGEMFFHNKDVVAPPWQFKPLPAHAGDVDAELASSTDGDMEIRVATYQRMENSKLIVYGYFAMQHKSRRSDDGKFLGENGEGVKNFDNFWKSMGQKD